MIFVPLPLFATFTLTLAAIYMTRTGDLAHRATRYFIALAGLYAAQALLLSLRWGYGVTALGPLVAALAPTLPAIAYLGYRNLRGGTGADAMLPMGAIALNWLVLLVVRDLADPLIAVTYIGFGSLIVADTLRTRDTLALIRFGQVETTRCAMILMGAALICSGLTDLFILVDFIRTGGAHVGNAVSVLQTAFLLGIGIAALAGLTGTVEEESPGPEARPGEDATEEDSAVMARLQTLVEAERIHLDTDLTLRRIARKLRLPDRAVSRAINRSQGTGVSQYINRLRIEEACRLLEATDQTVLEISLEAGFLTKSNFNREFTRVTGMAPSAWRARAKAS